MIYRLTEDDDLPPVVDERRSEGMPRPRRRRLETSAAPDADVTPAQRLAGYAVRIRRRWPLVALLTSLVAIAAFVHSSRQPDQYEATATLLFPQLQPASVALGTSAPQPADPEREANTNVKLVKLDPVADDVRTALHNRQSTSELLNRVRASVDQNSDLISLTIREATPKLAAAAANAFADKYVAFRRKLAEADIDRVMSVTTEQLNSLSKAERSTVQGVELRARLRELQVASVAQSSQVHVVQRAAVPTAAASPHPKRAAFLGLVLGFMFAVVVALTVDRLDPRLRAEEDIEAAFGLPILESLRRDSHASGGAVLPAPAERTAYQRLAAHVRIGGVDHGVLLVTGTGSESGQAAVSLGVAQALALDGQRVAVIDLDAANPSLGRLAQVRAGALETALADPQRLEEAWTELDSTALVPTRTASKGAAVCVLAASAKRDQASEEISTSEARAVVATATDLVDTVIVTTPRWEDGLTVADMAGGALLVAPRNDTTKAAAARVHRSLALAGAHVLGVVLTEAPRRHRLGGLRLPASWRALLVTPRAERVA